MNNKNKKIINTYAFTIVELLIVIVIIGILAAITIVSYRGITQRATEATLQADLSNASKKIKLYFADHGVYPATMPLGANGIYCPSGPVDDNYCIKPSAGNSFLYNLDSAQSFSLTSSKGLVSYIITQDSSPKYVEPEWTTIGSQIWAKKNLNAGVMIIGTSEQTNNSIVEKYCYGNLESNCQSYGALYQWNEMMQYVTTEGTQGICPAGSHVPSDNDWKILEISLGMTQTQADSISTWRGTNQGTQIKVGGSSGLDIPLGGRRGSDGTFNPGPGAYGYLRTSTQVDATTSWMRILDPVNTTIYREAQGKAHGFSVRCIKN